VAQLHVHHIARFHTDDAWPGPVWGVGSAVPYSDAARDGLIGELRSLLREPLGLTGAA
jgi:diadenosine tetraphosphate (Ap4A) HIT family hydrolase